MFYKILPSVITVTCVTLYNSSNAAVDINFYQNNKCEIICDGRNKTFNGSKDSLDEVNYLISNYFNIDSINYDKKSNTINFKCLPLKQDTNCVLILNYVKEQNNNEPLYQNITINGGDNTFSKLIILGFYKIKFTNIDAEICISNSNKELINTHIKTHDKVISMQL